MSLPEILARLAALAVVAPAVAFAALGAFTLLLRAPSERVVSRVVLAALTLSALSSLVVWGCAVIAPDAFLAVDVGHWFKTREYEFDLVLLIDRLSSTMMLLVSLIALVVGRFSIAYLHREAGFTRFFLLLSLFATGMLALVSAGTVDVFFAGWELVGVTSVLLVAFFHERAAPARAAARVYVTYRLCDIGLLVGVVLMHELAHSSHFEAVLGGEAWPGTGAALGQGGATALALCFLVAAMGKSAQFPVGSWLPRAMEGPTPSSALFYGAISVHAGVYLLLRLAPLLQSAPAASAVVAVVGALTAVYATLVGRAQSDVKSALAHATMSQVGIMFIEIGLGFYQLALVHLFAHACLRCLQLLRAPSALRDAQDIRSAHEGAPLPQLGLAARLLPARLVRRVYWLALERFHLEALQERFVAAPVMRLGQRLDRVERRLVATLAGVGDRSGEGGGGGVARGALPAGEGGEGVARPSSGGAMALSSRSVLSDSRDAGEVRS
ncbi:proton-conducting transporter transmembrane domain-containing protein [Chondromyces apiculatus]|uniref:NADH-ubiquinone oxidoreductase chain L n=1 Tax=Chondromyces apiculatus DSM 436 TaxID=1192034 RepID=A0A017T319_9BACT|nr:proton-conducting transporter membrane subunit [Chondromyces apiculatus]EYF02946.1 NADH-ubiquinone oxidoreductase chain L [Chondromyces apiculatus DSM 436]